MSLQTSQPYKCIIPTWQLCWARRATLKVGVTFLPYFDKKKWDISHFAPAGDFWWLSARFHQLSLCLTWSAVISVTQLSQSCHPEVDTSKVMKQNMSLWASQPYKCTFPTWQLCQDFEELPSKLVSHAYLILTEISKISHVLHLWWLLVTQQGFTNFLCLTWSAVISVTQLWQSCHPERRYLRSYEAKCLYKLPSPTNA